MQCRCNEISELDGAAAVMYADEHLQEVKVDSTNWIVEFVCPETGKRWIMDYPYAAAHGGGPPRVRLVPG